MQKTSTVLLLMLLTACSAAPVLEGAPDSAYRQRSEALQSVVGWDFIGQLAMDDGNEGGSGRLHWRAREASSRLDFRGALGRGAWRLSVEPAGAVLEKGDGTSARAATVDQLIQHEIGWEIPVNSLRWWVLGIAAPGDYQAMDLDETGSIRQLAQDGWTIDFERYQVVDGIRLPRKMEAVSGPYRVKLAISRWALQPGDSGLE